MFCRHGLIKLHFTILLECYLLLGSISCFNICILYILNWFLCLLLFIIKKFYFNPNLWVRLHSCVSLLCLFYLFNLKIIHIISSQTLEQNKGVFILASLGIGWHRCTPVARVEAMPTFVRRRRPMHTDASMNAPWENRIKRKTTSTVLS